MGFNKGWEPPADTAVHCAFCLLPAPEAGATRCRRCKVVYHPDCWTANNSRCAVYGCEPGIISAGPVVTAPRRPPATASSGSGANRHIWVIGMVVMFIVRLIAATQTSKPSSPQHEKLHLYRNWNVQRQNDPPDDVDLFKNIDPDGEFENTMDSYSRAIARNPRSARAWQGRGFLEYDRHEWQSALADFREALKIGGVHDDYVRFRIWMIESRTSDRSAADQALAASLEGRTAGPWEAWIASYLLGRTTESTLLQQANTDARLCQALYYVGTRHLIDGDREGARMYFLRCADTREENFREFHSASAELRQLK